MFSATEANRIANSYQSRAKDETMTYLEETIIERAKDGLKWFCWNYEIAMIYDGLTQNEKQEIISELCSAGYEVKECRILKQITIRW